MKTNFIKHTAMAACLGSLMWGSIALADGWPQSVVGEWKVVVNRSMGTLSVSYQDDSGQCKAIMGSIFGSDMKGFYCPDSGRIGFVRIVRDKPVQFYVGNVSRAGKLPVLAIGGTVAIWDYTGGINLGEYNFSAGKEDNTPNPPQ